MCVLRRSLALLTAMFCMSVPGLAQSPEGPEVTGANVPEDLVKTVLYVSVEHSKASDTNPGTEELPLKSISQAATRALANRAQGSGTKILIAPGIYRDAVRLPRHNKDHSDAPIVFEATENGKAILSGSDIFNDWHAVDGKENLYWHHWPHKWGPREQIKDPVWIRCGIFYRPILLQKETLYCNGQLQKLVLSPLDLREGTHYVSEDEEKLIAWLPKGLDARAALMEVPVRDRLFVGRTQRNIVIRGLVIRHDNSYFGMQSACAFGSASRNILIEDVRFEWNNCGGYGFNTCRDLTVRRVVANHNGGTGLSGCRLHNILFEDTENSYNNWRGDWGEYYSWSVGATKFLVIHGAVFRRNRSIGNHGLGFWFDTDCTDVLVDGAWWVKNERAGIFIEANQGPITIRNSVLAFNQHGVTSTNSSRVTLENNLIYGNLASQIGPMGQRDRPIKTWQWNGKRQDIVTQIKDWTLRDNIIVSTTSRQSGLNLTYQDPDLFLKTLTSDGNVWYGESSPRIVSLAGVQMTLAEWQTTTGQDSNSRFETPGLVDPGNLNLWQVRAARRERPSRTSPESKFDAEKARDLLDAKQKQLIDANWNTPFPNLGTVRPDQWLMLNLKPHVNRPMRGTDGWMGVGNLTLDWLEGGRSTIHGVPFQILDPTKGKLACIALRSFKVQRTGQTELAAKVTIPVGKKLRALHILHGCGWAKHATIGQYRIVYEDGTARALDIIPYGSGSEHLDVMERLRKESTIQDWWPALAHIENDRLRPVIVANPENLADKRYIYHVRWVNPSPSKLVTRLELESDPKASASIFVVAATAILAE